MKPSNDFLDVVYWIRGAEHTELAKLSIASVRKVYPLATVFVYTDDPQRTPSIEDTVRCELPPGQIAMVANVHAQMLHLNSCDIGRKVLFLDTDTILRGPFPFSGDLVVTWRDHDSVRDGQKVVGVAGLMPYNYGVIGVEVSAAAREAFTWLKARVLNMAPANQRWYGNQLALADLVGGFGEPHKTVRVRWSGNDPGTELRVSLLPCDVYNYSPEAEGEDVTGKVVLHMKGGRKHLMTHYAGAA